MRRPLNVLVVEDNPDVRSSTIDLITQAGNGLVHATPTSTLHDAMAEADKGSYSVVLLDLILPDAHGTLAIDEFQAKYPELPLVVLSGVKDADLMTEAIHHGAMEFIVKGDTVADLLERVRLAVVVHEVRKGFQPLTSAVGAFKDTLGKLEEVAHEREAVGRSGVNRVRG